MPYYWIGGEPPAGEPDPGTDIGALEEGYDFRYPPEYGYDGSQADVGARQWELQLPRPGITPVS